MKRMLLGLGALFSVVAVQAVMEDGSVKIQLANDTDGALKVVQNMGLLDRFFDRTASFRLEPEVADNGHATHKNTMNICVVPGGSYTFSGEKGATYVVTFGESFTKWPNQRVVNYPADLNKLVQDSKKSSYVQKHHISAVKELTDAE